MEIKLLEVTYNTTLNVQAYVIPLLHEPQPYSFLSDRDFLGVRPILNGVAQPYEWQSHNTVKRRIENYAKGLQKLGLGRQESLGVYGVNRPEWVSVYYYNLQN
jgi:hypothetical protein